MHYALSVLFQGWCFEIKLSYAKDDGGNAQTTEGIQQESIRRGRIITTGFIVCGIASKCPIVKHSVICGILVMPYYGLF